MDRTRYKRVRRLIRGLNQSRRIQARKIDILCNDMVNAHGEFAAQVTSLKFVADFYEALLGKHDLTGVLAAAANRISDAASSANVAIFLLESDGFELYMTDEERPIEVHAASFEGCFTTDIVRSISAAGRICTLEDMFDYGLVLENADNMPQLSAAGIPLRPLGPAMGFILIYRSAEHKLTAAEVQRVATVTPGLCRAIDSIQTKHRTSQVHD